LPRRRQHPDQHARRLVEPERIVEMHQRELAVQFRRIAQLQAGIDVIR
jgi:hypothetical protein